MTSSNGTQLHEFHLFKRFCIYDTFSHESLESTKWGVIIRIYWHPSGGRSRSGTIHWFPTSVSVIKMLGTAMFKEQTFRGAIRRVPSIPAHCGLTCQCAWVFDPSLLKHHSWQSRWLCQKSSLMVLQHAGIMLITFVTFRAFVGKTNAWPIWVLSIISIMMIEK